jgi:VanZ family protein
MKTLYKFALLLAWMLLIFLFSSEVANSSSARSDVIVQIVSQSISWPQDILTFLIRKAAHIFIYFVLGVLMINVVKDFTPTTRRAVLLSILCVMLYAVSDELHQLFIPGRSAELRDVLIDTAAGSVGVGLYIVLSKIHKNSKISNNSV